MCFGGGSNAGDQARQQQQQQQADITKGLGQINQVFSGFDPQFYQQRAQAYYNYALPYLQQQTQNQQNQQAFGLANRGLSQSTTARDQQAQLASYTGQQQQNIANTGSQQAQDLQSQVGQEQSNLISQLEASANPGATTQQALAAASRFAAPSAFPAIGNLFGNFASIYGANQQANQYNNFARQYLNPYQGYSGIGNSVNLVNK